MTREDMFHKLTLRYEELVCKYADKNVPDKQFFEELCCSIYSGDEFYEPEEPIKLDNDYCFKYRGYEFELTPCTMLINKAQVLETADAFKHGRVRGIFTDRYVCWMFGHKDSDGKTLKEYLEDNPDETEQSHSWSREIYLVPGAWSWGAEFDCDPGCEVNKLILDEIDKFLKQNPDL
jgi:hypothetical protein